MWFIIVDLRRLNPPVHYVRIHPLHVVIKSTRHAPVFSLCPFSSAIPVGGCPARRPRPDLRQPGPGRRRRAARRHHRGARRHVSGRPLLQQPAGYGQPMDHHPLCAGRNGNFRRRRQRHPAQRPGLFAPRRTHLPAPDRQRLQYRRWRHLRFSCPPRRLRRLHFPRHQRHRQQRSAETLRPGFIRRAQLPVPERLRRRQRGGYGGLPLRRF